VILPSTDPKHSILLFEVEFISFFSVVVIVVVVALAEEDGDDDDDVVVDDDEDSDNIDEGCCITSIAVTHNSTFVTLIENGNGL
jgi:hypothetical protein